MAPVGIFFGAADRHEGRTDLRSQLEDLRVPFVVVIGGDAHVVFLQTALEVDLGLVDVDAPIQVDYSDVTLEGAEVLLNPAEHVPIIVCADASAAAADAELVAPLVPHATLEQVEIACVLVGVESHEVGACPCHLAPPRNDVLAQVSALDPDHCQICGLAQARFRDADRAPQWLAVKAVVFDIHVVGLRDALEIRAKGLKIRV